MTRTLIVHEEAELELLAAFEWYETRRTGLGTELLDEVARTTHALRDGFDGSPFVTTASGDTARRALIERFPYAIVFVPEGPYIHVIAFAHQRRRPGYWRRRR